MSEGKKNTTAFKLFGLVATMCALSFAAVPFYSWFCQVTGFAGQPQQAESGSDEILDRTITVRFDASKVRGMPWEFKAMQTKMTLRIGETGLAFFEAYNPTNRPVAGSASYNVAPFSAGYHFTKIECFCFTEQILQPGERMEMPVSFYVDPSIVDDPEAKNLTSITLSYTFHETDLPAEVTSLTNLKQDQFN